MSNFIAIKTPTGQWLELGNTEIDFELESPVFRFDTIPGEKSLAFNLPVTDTNNHLLNYPGRVANTAVFNRVLPGYELYFGGHLWAKGNLYVVECSPRAIEVSFQTTVARINTWKDTLITDYNLGGGFTIPGLTLTAAEAYMATRSTGAGPYDFVFPTIKNVSSTFFDNVNNFNMAVGGGYDILTSNFRITPTFYLHFILKELEYVIGFEHKGSFIDDAELRNLVFYSPVHLIDVTFFAHRFLPDIKIRDLYKGLSKMFCLSYFFSKTDNTLQVKYFTEIYNRTDALDITSITSPDNITKFIEDKGTRLSMQNDSGDGIIISDSNEFYYGTSPFTNIDTELSYPVNGVFTEAFTGGSATFKVPHTEQDGDYPNGGSKPSFSTRLLFYRGYQVSSTAVGYPLASFDDKLWDNSVISGTNYTLEWDGAKGLYNKFWKEYTEFMAQTRRDVFDVQLSLEHILAFDFSRPIRIKSNEFLVDKLKFKASTRGITNCKLEVYRK